MGIAKNVAKFLFYATDVGVSYRKTLMLGRQQVYASVNDVQKMLRTRPVTNLPYAPVDEYAEELFRVLGALKVDSMDYSTYENATVIHDLNLPIPENLKGKYSAIVDSGTLEHVFNFPVAVKNCMEMLEVGGCYIGVTPANNQCGHGFYQFSPELFFSLFSPKNGFIIEKLFLAIGEKLETIFEVVSPHLTGERVTLTNEWPTNLLVIAKKTEQLDLSQLTIYQSDYENAWEKRPVENKNPGAIKRWYRKILPKKFRDWVWLHFLSSERHKKNIRGLGRVNPEHYKQIDLG